ncbi:MAG: hypothetical protein ACOYXT_18365 [Bacteroidota bacterium]
MDNKLRSTIQELLVSLYLRLNGYLTSGFILHSQHNSIEGEIDLVAVRFPYHRQPETEHNSSPYLEVPDNIDVVIAEVKSKGESLQFNKSLRERPQIVRLLNWLGLFTDDCIDKASDELVQLIVPKPNSSVKTFLSTSINTNFGRVTIRPIIFSPERIHVNNANKFIHWTELNDFIWHCLCPPENRVSCGTRYDFNAWGAGLNDVVRIYKARQKEKNKPEKIDDIYSAFPDNLKA